MKHVSEEIRNTIGKALGRVPSGVFILTAASGNESTAMLASWVQQVAFEPPAIAVSIASDRPVARMIRDSAKLALSVIGEGDTMLMKRYARGVKDGEDPFAGMNISRTPAGLVVMADAIAWLEAKVMQTCEFGADHDLFIAQVTAGQLLREGSSFVHQRGSGFHY
jgi:flavin reductase (DIM6/NTAB) family NADH-FMN oxidoreductase RutF